MHRPFSLAAQIFSYRRWCSAPFNLPRFRLVESYGYRLLHWIPRSWNTTSFYIYPHPLYSTLFTPSLSLACNPSTGVSLDYSIAPFLFLSLLRVPATPQQQRWLSRTVSKTQSPAALRSDDSSVSGYLTSTHTHACTHIHTLTHTDSRHTAKYKYWSECESDIENIGDWIGPVIL